MTTELKKMYYDAMYENDTFDTMEELICYLKNWYDTKLIKADMYITEQLINELDKDYPTDEEDERLEEAVEYQEFLLNLFYK
jgi:hypothetical protein